MKLTGKHERDLCNGPILKALILYSLPLLVTNILQLLFNAADVAVLGMFVNDDAVAAVGATGALINLIVNLFVGLSTGANVLVARFVGEQDPERAHRTVGTSVVISLIFGVFLAGIGWFFSGTFLGWMGCDPDVIEMATRYMQIYFLGMPIIMLYNFAASILRAVGDTTRPLIYLVIGGALNLGLNIFFVTVCGMDVEGVAIATVASQLSSAIFSMIAMVRSTGYCRLSVPYLRLFGKELRVMTQIGLPAGLQGCVFAISNVLIQSSVNSLGKVAMAGATVAGQFDGLIYNAMYAVALAALAFVSQNLGAGKLDRVRRSVRLAVVVATGIGVIVGWVVILLRDPLCRIISQDPDVLAFASERIWILSTTYFFCGIMDTLSNSMRGLGKSTTAMVVSLSGSCLFRILWVNTVFLWQPTPFVLYLVYPISWALTALIQGVCYLVEIRKVERRFAKTA